MIFKVIFGYLISLIISWIIIRYYYKILRSPEQEPHALIFVTMFIPIANIIIPCFILFGEIAKNINYKNFYKIK
jgi:hypothetical protein